MVSNKKFWLYSFAYFLWFGALGAYFPYATLFLSRRVGISVGTVFFFWGVVSLAQAFFVPPLGVLADRCGKRQIFSLILICFILSILLSLVVSAKWIHITLFLFQGVFVGALSSFLDAQCLEEACFESNRPFGFIRAAGTLGWCVINLFLAYLFREAVGGEHLDFSYLSSSILMLILLMLFLDLRESFKNFNLKGSEIFVNRLKTSLTGFDFFAPVRTCLQYLEMIPSGIFSSFLLPVFMIGFAYSAVMLVLPPHIEAKGFGASTLAGSVSFGSLLEIVLFPLATTLSATLSPAKLAAYGGILLFVRAWAAATALTPEVLVLAFFLTHSTGFALFTTGSTLAVNDFATPQQRAFYQTLVTAFGWKAAQSAAAFVAFFFVEFGTPFESVLWTASIAGFVGALLLYLKALSRRPVFCDH